LIWAEVHEHGVVFHAEDDAEPVCVVRHLIMDGERLGRARRGRGVERAAGQGAPDRAAGCLHSYHHAPSPARAGRAGALQLRLLQTVVEVAAEKNSTLVMPVPVELLRFFDKFTPPAPAGDRKSAADAARARGVTSPGNGPDGRRIQSKDSGQTRTTAPA
jgi:hypothetical protein